MKKLACRDLGMDCDHVITADTVEEIKERAMAHAQARHGDILKTMSSPAQLAEMGRMIESMTKEA